MPPVELGVQAVEVGAPFHAFTPFAWKRGYTPVLHGNALIPDLAGWRRESMPELPNTAAFELAPDWLCEVLSPGTSAPFGSADITVGASGPCCPIPRSKRRV